MVEEVCQKCFGRKHIRNAKGLYDECPQCMRGAKVATNFNKCNFPKVFEDQTFSNFQLSSEESNLAKRAAEAAAEDYAKSLPLSVNLYFWDGYQVYGKLLSSLIAKSALKSLFSCYFVTVNDIFNISMSSEESPISFKELKNQDLLVVELSKDFMNKKIPALLNEIIYHRYNEKLPILYNSIHDMSQVSIYYDPSIFKLMQVTKVKQLKIIRQ